jgi:hypothetical protein
MTFFNVDQAENAPRRAAADRPLFQQRAGAVSPAAATAAHAAVPQGRLTGGAPLPLKPFLEAFLEKKP